VLTAFSKILACYRVMLEEFVRTVVLRTPARRRETAVST
jgi:hypothetical protein